MRVQFLKCAVLLSWGALAAQCSVAAEVVWNIDSTQSWIRLSIPDQDIPLDPNDPPVGAGARDFGDEFTMGADWTDAGGRRSSVQGTISTNYVAGTSLEFNDGSHSASAKEFGAFQPDPAAWNGTVYDPPTATAPAAFAAQLGINAQGEPPVIPLGVIALRNINYDLLGSVGLTPSGGGWQGTNDFSVGILAGAYADARTVIGDLREELLDLGVNAANTGTLTIQDMGGGVHKLTLPISIEVDFDVNGVILDAFATGVIVATATVTLPATIVSRAVHHAGFSGAGTPPNNGIDSGKVVAKEGGGPTVLGYNNVINTSRGINGVSFEIQNLGNAGALSASDFTVQVSPTGAFDTGANPPAGWVAGPAPSSVTVVAGSPDRVFVQWPNNSIMNRWLRLTVKANANTGLTSPETYYVGHLLGETTGLSGGVYTVAFADIGLIRNQAGNTVNASSIHDIDKNGTVSFADISAMQPNVGAQLSNVTIP